MESNPLLNIWCHPRLTVQRLILENPRLHVLMLAAIAGIGEGLDKASTKNLGDRFSFFTIVLSALILGPLGGLLSLWTSSHLTRFTGRWLGGEAPILYLRTALAWAGVPVVVGTFLWLPLLAIAGAESFTEDAPYLQSHSSLSIAVVVISIIQMILGIWSLVLASNTIAEVQGYGSAWRGFWNLFLSGAVLIIPIMILVFGIMFIVV